MALVLLRALTTLQHALIGSFDELRSYAHVHLLVGLHVVGATLLLLHHVKVVVCVALVAHRSHQYVVRLVS